MSTSKDKLKLARQELARAGGIARAKALTREERRAIARKGGLAGGRSRRKGENEDDLLPDELREKIWALAAAEGATTLWRIHEEATRPETKKMAVLLLRDLSKHGSLKTYRLANELLQCLS